MISPRTHALRFRIWQHCEPRGWDVTVREIADALDESVGTISNTLKLAGWLNRVRVSRLDSGHVSMMRHRAGQLTAADVVSGRIEALADA